MSFIQSYKMGLRPAKLRRRTDKREIRHLSVHCVITSPKPSKFGILPITLSKRAGRGSLLHRSRPLTSNLMTLLL